LPLTAIIIKQGAKNVYIHNCKHYNFNTFSNKNIYCTEKRIYKRFTKNQRGAKK